MKLNKIVFAGRDNKIQDYLQKLSSQLFAADCINDLNELISSVEPQAIVFDSTVARSNLSEILCNLEDSGCSIPVVVFGPGESDPIYDLASTLPYAGYIKETHDCQCIDSIIEKIIKGNSQEDDFFIENRPADLNIVGKSLAAKRSLNMITMVAKSNCNPALIIGETGTGKEMAARAIHIIRHGKDKPFVAINCAALTANLLESELFGHTKGSFTSADKDKTGLLEAASGGSIFLDEISEMPIDLQAKLLRVIQEKSFRKVGGLSDIEFDATIIASSNRNLKNEVENNRFRCDLYYRLCVCPITLSPLRSPDRNEDIPLLARYFIKTSNICPDKNGKIKGLTRLAMETLQKHSWPGNVRELKNVIDRAILLENSDKIGLSNLMIFPESVMEQPESLVESAKDFSLEKAEKELIAKALKEAGWQKTRAATLLGITRATLYAKVRHYNIEQPQVQTVEV